MKSKLIGTPRIIDDVGRMTIPAHYRKHFNIFPGDIVYVYMNDNNELVILPENGGVEDGTRENF